jgi:hypothetical protein
MGPNEAGTSADTHACSSSDRDKWNHQHEVDNQQTASRDLAVTELAVTIGFNYSFTYNCYNC